MKNFIHSHLTFRFLACWLLLTPCFFLSSPTKANDGAISPTIGIAPAKFIETVKPGQASQFQIRLHNYGKDPLPLSAVVQGIDDINNDGQPSFTDLPSARTAKDWISLEPKDVILNTNQQKTITVTVTPPADTAPGGYNAGVIFRANLPSYYFDLDANTRVLPSIASLFFFTIASDNLPTVQDLKITSVQVPKVVVSTPISVVSNVENPSNFFIQADTVTTIKGGLKSNSQSDNSGSVILLPSGPRKFVAAFESRLLPGIYTATIQLKQGDKVLVSSAHFVALPWPFLIGSFLLICLLLFFGARRRLGLAWRALLGREIPAKPQNRQRPILR